MIGTRFDPFRDRMSRDIRNSLSAAFTRVFVLRDLSPARAAAGRLLRQSSGTVYHAYIRDRLASYEKFLQHAGMGSRDIFRQVLVLWDLGLFYEFHEVLEQEWRRAAGEERQVLQAMIRAAGAYIKLESGYRKEAEKIAARALPVLEQYGDQLAGYFDPGTLRRHLRDLDLPPPRLSATRRG